ncbi:MAG TPA: hypothetical protein PKA93_01380 [Arachnia sp.]|nr:hypothetical protein [Arachnia sp.]
MTSCDGPDSRVRRYPRAALGELIVAVLARGWRRYVGTPRRYRGGSRARAR